MALPAFLASVCSTQDLANRICCRAFDADFEEARDMWLTTTRLPAPVEEQKRHATWAAPLMEQKLSRVRSVLQTPADVARLLAASSESASCLYDCNPSSGEGTRLSDTTLTLAVGLRLGLPVAATGTCVCGEELDAHGDHALTCKRGVGRGARHKDLNERVRSALNEAGHVSVLELSGLTRTDGKRPDGVTVMPFERGLPMAWDVTVVHTCAPSYLRASVYEAGSVAAAAEAKKETKYAPIKGLATCRAVGIETLGVFGPSARGLFDKVAELIQPRTGDSKSRSRLYRRLAAAVQCGNAACIVESHARGGAGGRPNGAFSNLTTSSGVYRRAVR